MTATSVQRSAASAAALFLAAGLIVVQALIGGRGLLFAFPGLFLVGAAGLCAWAAVSHSSARVDLVCVYATAGFVGYVILRGLASPTYFARADLFTVIAAAVVYALTVTVINSARARLGICCALIAFALVHMLIGLVQFSGGNNFMPFAFLQRADYGQRASGFYVCPNHLAGLLEVVGIFGISLTCWSRLSLWTKILVGYATAMCYVGLALTGSRGGYVSALGSLIIFGALSLLIVRAARRDHWMKFAAIGLVAVAALVVSALIVIHQSDYLAERSRNIIDSKNVRLILWQAAIQQWHLQPIFGTGSGSYQFYGREFRTREMQNDPIDVHNDYLHLLCEYGALGALGFLAFFAAHLRHGWRNFAQLRARSGSGHGPLLSNRLALHLAALASIGAYVIHSGLDFNLHIPANALLLAFVFGLIANPGTSHQSASPESRRLLHIRLGTALIGAVLLIQTGRLFAGEYFTERARTALRDEDPAGAIVLAEKALRHERQNPEIHFYLGRAFVAAAHQTEEKEEQRKFFEQALNAFQKAQRLAPLDGTYPLNLAFIYDEMGRLSEAERMYEQARARDPHSIAVAQLYHAHRQLVDAAAFTVNQSM